MDYVIVIAVSVVAGLLAWAIAKTVIDIRHWWENEMERWSDFMREVRQFFEQLVPIVVAGVTVVVIGGAGIYFSTVR